MTKVVAKSAKPKSVPEKRRIAMSITKEIAHSISLLNEKDFTSMIKFLKELKENICNRNFSVPDFPDEDPIPGVSVTEQSHDPDLSELFSVKLFQKQLTGRASQVQLKYRMWCNNPTRVLSTFLF